LKNHRGPVAILFATLVIVMLGFGIVLPLMPYYVSHFGATGKALGLAVSIYSLMQFLFAPLWGRVSDRVGRKPVLLVGLLGFGLSFVLQGFSQSLLQFILARALAGILTSATLPTAMAYVADTTSAENRSRGMGLMGAAMGLGMIFGPLVGGLLTHVQPPLPGGVLALLQETIDPSTGQTINLSFPYLVSSLLAFAAIPLVILRLPESLAPESRDTSVQTRAGRLQTLLGALRGPLAFLSLLSFLMAFALANLEGILGLYAKDRFQLGPAGVGLVMGTLGIFSALQQGLLIGPAVRRYGDERVLQGGLLLSVIGMVGMALTANFAVMFLMALVFSTGNSFLRPSVTSLMSQRAPAGQGAAMGIANSFQSLGRAAGPLWGGFAYDFNPVLPFWSGALVQFVALLFSLRVPGFSTHNELTGHEGAYPDHFRKEKKARAKPQSRKV